MTFLQLSFNFKLIISMPGFDTIIICPFKGTETKCSAENAGPDCAYDYPMSMSILQQEGINTGEPVHDIPYDDGDPMIRKTVDSYSLNNKNIRFVSRNALSKILKFVN